VVRGLSIVVVPMAHLSILRLPSFASIRLYLHMHALVKKHAFAFVCLR